jgi:hypothetical protein
MTDIGGEMLREGMPAVEVMIEYVRACRQLGHPTPEPSRLSATYTAEEGMDLSALDADGRALWAVVAAGEEAQQLQEHARRGLAAAWRGAGADAAADRLGRHTDAAGAAVECLRAAADAVVELRNRLRQLIDGKIDTTLAIESRGMRAEWLSAARTVTTGVGDRADASELVDMQVAPFVANDIGTDWVTSMRDNESAVRRAYGTAAAAMGKGASVVFDSPGELGAFGTQTPVGVAAKQFSAPSSGEVVPAASIAATAPAGYANAPMAWSDPAPAHAVGAPAAVPGPPAAPPPISAVAPAAAPGPDPLAAAPPMAPLGGLGGGASPLGAGLSGAGQSFADMLGGLLGSGGGGLGESLVDDLDPGVDDPVDESEDFQGSDGPEEDDPAADGPEADGPEEDGPEEENADDADAEEETADGEEPAAIDPPIDDPAADLTEAVDPVVSEPNPSTSTPVPEPLAPPVVVEPVEPAPADTPCEIAADALPQAGP